VKCKVCSMITRFDKLLVPKLNSLWKHVGQRKVITTMSNVDVGEYYTLKTNQHVINE